MSATSVAEKKKHHLKPDKIICALCRASLRKSVVGFLTNVALCRCPGLMSLVPDFLSLGSSKPKLKNSPKITVLNLKIFALGDSVSHKEYPGPKKKFAV